MGLKTRISIAMREKYEELFNLSDIDIFMRKGMNINLNCDLNQQPDPEFYKQLIKLCIFFLLSLFCIICSWITWDNANINPVFVGNNWVGVDIPKTATLSIYAYTTTILISKFITSYLVYKKDHHLVYLIRLIQLVSGSKNKPYRGMNPAVINQLKKEISYLIAVLKLILQIFKGPQIFGIILVSVPFYLLSSDNVTTYKLIFTTFWSLYFAAFLNQTGWTNATSFLIITIVCRFFLITIKKMDQEKKEIQDAEEMNDESNAIDSRLKYQNIFFNRMNQSMYILHYIRRYDQSIRLIIGINVFYFCATSIYFSLVVFFIPISTLIKLVFATYLILFLFLLFLMLKLISEFSYATNIQSRYLMNISNKITLKSNVKHKINYIIEEMRYNTSFGCFKFIPDIDYIFIIKVSLRMKGLF